jgi:hypothetical protein
VCAEEKEKFEMEAEELSTVSIVVELNMGSEFE